MKLIDTVDGVEFWQGSGNVYADLNFPDAEELMVKTRLVAKIGEIIKRRRWSQRQAAEALGMTQAQLSKMLRGQFDDISQAKMLECLTRLGRDVQIVVGRSTRRAPQLGRMAVVFA